jgi:hypothetical protein
MMFNEDMDTTPLAKAASAILGNLTVISTTIRHLAEMI